MPYCFIHSNYHPKHKCNICNKNSINNKMEIRLLISPEASGLFAITGKGESRLADYRDKLLESLNIINKELSKYTCDFIAGDWTIISKYGKK